MKNLKEGLSRAISIQDAWNQAEDMTVRHQAALTQSRMHEHFLEARERGDIKGDFDTIVKRSQRAFSKIDHKKFLSDGTGVVAASKVKIAKKSGLDEGPD